MFTGLCQKTCAIERAQIVQSQTQTRCVFVCHSQQMKVAFCIRRNANGGRQQCSSERRADVMATVLVVPLYVLSEIRLGLHQSMRIYLKNNPVKFHPDQI